MSNGKTGVATGNKKTVGPSAGDEEPTTEAHEQAHPGPTTDLNAFGQQNRWGKGKGKGKGKGRGKGSSQPSRGRDSGSGGGGNRPRSRSRSRDPGEPTAADYYEKGVDFLEKDFANFRAFAELINAYFQPEPPKMRASVAVAPSSTPADAISLKAA